MPENSLWTWTNSTKNSVPRSPMRNVAIKVQRTPAGLQHWSSRSEPESTLKRSISTQPDPPESLPKSSSDLSKSLERPAHTPSYSDSPRPCKRSTPFSKLLDSKIDKRRICKLLYLVRWTGYEGTDEETSRLPAMELEHASEAVSDFHHTYPNKPGPLNLLPS